MSVTLERDGQTLVVDTGSPEIAIAIEYGWKIVEAVATKAKAKRQADAEAAEGEEEAT